MDLMNEIEVRGVAGGGVQGLMDAGEFPLPVEHGPGGRRWNRVAVERWHAGRVQQAEQSRVQQRPAGHGERVQTRPAE